MVLREVAPASKDYFRVSIYGFNMDISLLFFNYRKGGEAVNILNKLLIIVVVLTILIILSFPLPNRDEIYEDAECNILCKYYNYTGGYMGKGECIGGECVCDGHPFIWEGLNELRHGNITIPRRIRRES